MRITSKKACVIVAALLVPFILWVDMNGWIKFFAVFFVLATFGVLWEDFKKSIKAAGATTAPMAAQDDDDDKLQNNAEYIADTLRKYIRDEMWEDAAELLQETRAIRPADKAAHAADILEGAATSMDVGDYIEFYDAATGAPWIKAKTTVRNGIITDLALRIEDEEEMNDLKLSYDSKLVKDIAREFSKE